IAPPMNARYRDPHICGSSYRFSTLSPVDSARSCVKSVAPAFREGGFNGVRSNGAAATLALAVRAIDRRQTARRDRGIVGQRRDRCSQSRRVGAYRIRRATARRLPPRAAKRQTTIGRKRVYIESNSFGEAEP